MQSDREREVIAARARANVLSAVADLLLPPTDEVAARVASGEMIEDLRRALRDLPCDAAGPLLEELGRLRGPTTRADLAGEHLRVFGPSVGSLHPPYSTEHDTAAPFRKEQDLADIAGYYRAFGVALHDDLHERVDHMGVEADFLAFLAMKEAYALCEDGPHEVAIVRAAAARFAREIVAPAARSFAERLARAEGGLFAAAAALLCALVDDARAPGDIPRRRVAALPVVAALAAMIALPAAARADAPDGKQLYSNWCAPCHGAAGDGKGKLSYLLFPKPRDFTKGVFKFRSAPMPSVPTDEDLLRVVTAGIPGTAMPSWSFLPEEERRALVRHLKTFSPEFGKPPAPPAQIPAGPAPTPEDVARGKELYVQMRCPSCHGESGRGDGPSAATLKDDYGDPIWPYDFTGTGGFRGGGTPQDLYRTMVTGLAGTPMPSFADAMPDQNDRWALVAFIRSLATGAEKVPPAATSLKAARVPQVPTTPDDAAWDAVPAASVELRPSWWRKVSPDRVSVKVAADDRRIAFLLEWDDAGADQRTLRSDEFRDAAAVQFALGVSEPAKAPFVGMGSPNKPIEIWHWKADWQADLARRADVQDEYPNMFVEQYPLEDRERAAFHTGEGAGNAFSAHTRKSPVEALQAIGPGSLTAESSDHQNVMGAGVWRDGKWHVVVHRERAAKAPDEVAFDVEQAVVAFAVWDGSAGDRNGQKAVSAWLALALGEAAGGEGGCQMGVAPAAAGGGVLALLGVAALLLRRRRRVR